ncbi:aryldialkylphosphatase [Leucobacter allii]|uniref:Aryldialkylphosphatase n=1 Tax=Leucobacter allii TaxID=2932247 RepID=A0ABY4FNM5_9MICO|nr:aryldialkylphosphatase [Leucobacter allii]UOQ57877.1 aryldialkylphosphatase [Leucobacter allii]
MMNDRETPFVRTVLGDVAPESLGRVNYHEHLFQATPLLPGEELADERLSGEEAALMRAGGIDAMVDATPWGLGRDPEAVARISARTGLSVIVTAGFHREAHYAGRTDAAGLDLAAMTAQCVAELHDGQPAVDGDRSGASRIARAPHGAPVRAGMLKAGVGYWSISPFERRALAAVAAAHRVSGAPIMVHLEHGTCAHEALDILAEEGVAENRIVLAHIDRSPDPILYAELAARGAYLGCDGAARLKEWPESLLIDAIAGAAEAGHADRVLLGGDVARRSRYAAYGGMPGIGYLTSRFIPRLAARVGPDVIRAFLETNPRSLLAWSTPAG